MTEPFRPAELHGLPDGCRSERLASVDGEVEVLPLQELEGVEVQGRRIAGFPAGDVEADDPALPEPDRGLSHRLRVVIGAHSCNECPDGQGGSGRPVGEAGQHDFYYLVEAHPLRGVQVRGEPDLGVHAAVVG